ncbi:hypothetical protein DSCW_34630 [Desulfosarcina widdelii]|uniref:Uncharacterized protein n=1 Tax=Desulfosarcina widdelii TaxID=947919 RepID=A0A5K7Z2U7_9BACT|nr:hypothetical protein [Desulfosarcina widdelii]BBO76046.1 hypothetical protein DSCW_34630 [Desulfosarcina widdelii]
MKRRVGLIFVVVLALIPCIGGAIFSPSQSLARSVVPIEGSSFDISLPLIDNLKIYMGKNVFIHLKSGKTLQGNVKAVGNNLVHLEKLTGKDFYDALINIEEINAIEAKFREMK